MSTLIIKANGIIKNPIYPKLLDINSGLRFRIDARALGLSQGAASNKVVADGIGDINERTFTLTTAQKGNNWTVPTYDGSDKPSLYFNGNQALANNATAYIKNATYITVLKVAAYSLDSTSRFFGMGKSDVNGYHGVYGYYDEYRMRLSNSGERLGAAPLVKNKWVVLITVFDGANSKAMVSSQGTINAVDGFTLDTLGQRATALGGNVHYPAETTPASITANIALFAQYDYAMSDSQMTDVMNYYMSDFSITA